MPVLIAMLRGVNVGGHNKIKMDALRALCESLKFRGAQTYVQSGNVVFRTDKRDINQVAAALEKTIEETVGFRPSVIVRTTAEMRSVIARNPFAARADMEPSKFLVTFLAAEPSPEARDKVLAIKADPEELCISGREIYIYFPNGMARPKLSFVAVEKALKIPGTGRNWNTVRKLLEIAEGME
jgi:uncharacterized protein (DUF1697 family)